VRIQLNRIEKELNVLEYRLDFIDEKLRLMHIGIKTIGIIAAVWIGWRVFAWLS
jgi:hypothetical protein